MKTSQKKPQVRKKPSQPARAPVAVDALHDPSAQDLRAQHKYVQQMSADEFDFTLTVSDAFVQGMRQIGYKSTATALDELIDNAIQAYATDVHITTTTNLMGEIEEIAVIDDGHGMEDQMIMLSVIWGGSHRREDRSGFGRFGFGLPSACVSQGRRYSVTSRTKGGKFHRVTVDLMELAAGKYHRDGKIRVPEAVECELDPHIQQYVDKHFGGLPRGSIIQLSNLDQLSWPTVGSFKTEMLQHLGVYYRNFLGNTNITVDGTAVEAVDPLFITKSAKFYDLDEERAEEIEPLDVPISDRNTGELIGSIHVRFSYLPPTFAHLNKADEKGKKNARWAILKNFNEGVIVCRQGRQIDVVKTPWKDLIHRDRYWGVEIDFPATLDELFHVSTSKQTVLPEKRIWTALEQAGVRKTIDQLKTRGKNHRALLQGQRHDPRPSELAMARAEAHSASSMSPPDEEKVEASRVRFEAEVARRSTHSGVPSEQVRAILEQEIRKRPFVIAHEEGHEGPFYRVELLGGQRRLYLNVSHPFYSEVYSKIPKGDALDGVELFLLVLAECEARSSPRHTAFYKNERAEWSKRLNFALDKLDYITDLHSRDDEDAYDDDDDDSGAVVVTN